MSTNKPSKPSDAIGAIDHVVIAVADLQQSADLYRRLGFTLSPKGVHSAELGTVNHTIMLGSDYFELLAVAIATERNEHWRQSIAAGGGVAGMAMTTVDASAAREHWLAAGLVPDMPMKFSRAVARPDGQTLEARFEVVSLDEVPGLGMHLFVCAQPTREAVWLPELTVHANTAQGIRRLRIACPDPDYSAAQWQRALPAARIKPGSSGVTIDTGRHQIELSRHDRPQVRTLGIDFVVADLAACRSALACGAVAHQMDGAGVALATGATGKVAIRFEAQA